MEAVAIFSIACNVMQTIKFGTEVASASKSVFRQGTATDPHFQDRVDRSRQAYETLQRSLGQFQPQNEDEYELARIGQECVDACTALSRAINRIQHPQAKGRLIASVARGLQAKLKQDKIDKLKNLMEGYQSVLELRLLIRVW